MPAAAKMQEAIRRRRAAGGPAEETFAALVGLELRPRRLRDASTLWGSLRSRQGKEARDAVWAHPDLLPTAADLDDPLGFREDLPEVAELSDEDFDKALGELLDREGGEDGDPATQGGRTSPASRAGDPARRRARRTHPLAGTDRGAGAAARVVRRPPATRTPTALARACFPDHLTAGALVLSHDRTHVLLNLHRKARRWFHFGGHLEAGDATLAGAALREATEESGLAGLGRGRRAAAPRPGTRWRSATPRAGATTSTCASSPASAADAEPVVSEESLDVRWWPVDDLPTDEPDMVELIGLALRRRASSWLVGVLAGLEVQRRPRGATPSRKPWARSARG